MSAHSVRSAAQPLRRVQNLGRAIGETAHRVHVSRHKSTTATMTACTSRPLRRQLGRWYARPRDLHITSECQVILWMLKHPLQNPSDACRPSDWDAPSRMRGERLETRQNRARRGNRKTVPASAAVSQEVSCQPRDICMVV